VAGLLRNAPPAKITANVIPVLPECVDKECTIILRNLHFDKIFQLCLGEGFCAAREDDHIGDRSRLGTLGLSVSKISS
jgi:hypothetical protein